MQHPDLPSLRRTNLLHLFSAFVAQRMAQSPSQSINGLDREFSALIQVNNTYFSGMKSGARTIGDKLARQVETLCQQPRGWLDESHVAVAAAPGAEKPTGLQDFLHLAEQAWLAAPRSHAKLVKVLTDVLKPHISAI